MCALKKKKKKKKRFLQFIDHQYILLLLCVVSCRPTGNSAVQGPAGELGHRVQDDSQHEWSVAVPGSAQEGRHFLPRHARPAAVWTSGDHAFTRIQHTEGVGSLLCFSSLYICLV